MEWSRFIDKDKAYSGFVKYRKKVIDASEIGKFDEAFIDLAQKHLKAMQWHKIALLIFITEVCRGF